MVVWKVGVSAQVSKPLEEALRDELQDRLRGVTGVIEVVECATEEVLPMGGAHGMRATKEVSILLEDGFAVRASMLY